MMKLFIVLLVVLIPSCTPSHRTEMITTRHGHSISFDGAYGAWFTVVDISYEEAWRLALQALAWHDWPVEKLVHESGAITTGIVNVGVHRDKHACQRWPNVVDVRCQLKVHISPLSASQTKIRVTAKLEAKGVISENVFREREVWRECESSGKIESEFLDTFLGRL